MSTVGVVKGGEDELKLYGVVSGKWDTDQCNILDISEFAEKPSIDYAKEHLRMDEGVGSEYCLLFGIYVLHSEIFSLLEENIRNDLRERGEYQLTSCLDEMRRRSGFKGIVVEGKRYDIGVPHAYRETVASFGK